MTLPRFLLTTGFTAICLMTGARHTWAQDPTAVGSISGVVTSGDGTLAAGVELCLQTGSRCVTADGGGVLKISDVRAGEFALEVTAPGLPTYPAPTCACWRGWRNATGVNWQHLFERGVGLLGVSHSGAHVDEQVKDLVRNVVEAGVPVATVIANSPIVFRENSRVGESTLKYDLTTYMPMLNKLQVGGSVKVVRVNYDAASPYGNDSPYSSVPGLDPFALAATLAESQTGGL